MGINRIYRGYHVIIMISTLTFVIFNFYINYYGLRSNEIISNTIPDVKISRVCFE